MSEELFRLLAEILDGLLVALRLMPWMLSSNHSVAQEDLTYADALAHLDHIMVWFRVVNMPVVVPDHYLEHKPQEIEGENCCWL